MGASVELIRITLDDRRLQPYRHLKRTNLTRWSGRFIAEGEKVVERLLASPFDVESILVSEHRTEWIERTAPAVPCYALRKAQCRELTGYEFHQGILACGIRRSEPALESIVDDDDPLLIVVAQRITDPDNLGTLIRLAAGFGARAVILGSGSADPLSRRALRVSMGAALRVPTITGAEIVETVRSLRTHRITSLATVLDPKARALPRVDRPRRMVLVFGNEADGLPGDVVAECDAAVTIPLDAGTDSLNVATAAAIFLYHFGVVRCVTKW